MAINQERLQEYRKSFINKKVSSNTSKLAYILLELSLSHRWSSPSWSSNAYINRIYATANSAVSSSPLSGPYACVGSPSACPATHAGSSASPQYSYSYPIIIDYYATPPYQSILHDHLVGRPVQEHTWSTRRLEHRVIHYSFKATLQKNKGFVIQPIHYVLRDIVFAPQLS